MRKQGKIFLQVYYYRQVADICSCLEAIPGNYRVRDIHKLRVRVKRLKSIFRLIEYRYPEEFRAKDYYKLYKAVFKSAGLVRESQINLGLFKEYPFAGNLRKSYYRHITLMKQQWRPGLDALIHSFNYAALDDHNRTIEKYLSSHSEPELIGIIEGFINKEILRISNLLKQEGDLHYIHSVRIILKNIKPLLGLIWRRKNSFFSVVHYDSLVETEKLIGNWHDRHIFSHTLKLFFNSMGEEKEKLMDEYLALQGDLGDYEVRALGQIRSSLARSLDLFSH